MSEPHQLKLFEADLVADRGGDHSRTLPAGFLGYERGYGLIVAGIEMAHRLVDKNKIKRLTESADDGRPLLLPY